MFDFLFLSLFIANEANLYIWRENKGMRTGVENVIQQQQNIWTQAIFGLENNFSKIKYKTFGQRSCTRARSQPTRV